jgi:hypothetical protein
MAENGPWDATKTQRFIRPLIDNLIAVLQADWDEETENPVHTEVNGSEEAMVPYERWRRSRWVNTKFPACSVIPRRTRTRKAEDGPLVEEAHTVEILIEDVGPNPDELADSVMKRVQAAHLIIERATLAALFTGYEPSRTHRSYWDIDHDYAQFFIEKSSYKQNGSLIITFTGLMEKT